METYYTNTTNITCQSNLLVRKHTLESRLDEIKTEFLKRTSDLVMNKTKDTIKQTKDTINNTINNYKQQASMLLNDDGFRNNVTAVVGPVFETTKTLHKLSNAIKTNQQNSELISNNKHLSENSIHKNIKTIRRINQIKKREEQIKKREETKIMKYDERKKIFDYLAHNEKTHNKIKEYEFLYFMKSKPILKVDKFIHMFKKQDYDYLIKKLDQDYVNRLTLCLIKLKKRANCNYKSIIQNYITILELIFFNVNLKISLKNAIGQAERYQLDSEILRNGDKLKEYLESLKGSSALFARVNTRTKLKLNRRYRIYVKKYGFPENGLFSPERMIEIDCMLEKSDCSSSSDSDC
jgi:hypothetical protein